MNELYATLYQALIIFREAMSTFLIEQLKLCYGREWWSEGARSSLGSAKANAIAKRYERRYGTEFVEDDPPTFKAHEFLELGDFPIAIEKNWNRCFAGVFDQRAEIGSWLREIVAVRNIVAHPESGGLTVSDVSQALDKMEQICRLVNPDAADQIFVLKGRVYSWPQVAEEDSDSVPIRVSIVEANQLRLSVSVPALLTEDEFFGSAGAVLAATTFIHSVFALLATGDSNSIRDFIAFLRNAEDLTTLPTTSPNQFMAYSEAAPLRIISAQYGSPASFDLLGVGKVVEVIRDIIKDIVWRGKHEREMAELERKNMQTEVSKAKLGIEKETLEIAAEKARLEKSKLENEKLMVEIASQKLDLIQKTTGMELADDDKRIIVAALLPKMIVIASDPSTPLLENR
jgi:type II secretory pathway component GspD/PulD (secretin)